MDPELKARLDALEEEHQQKHGVRNRKQAAKTSNGTPKNMQKIEHPPDEKTDHQRWRLRDERGRQTWEYLAEGEAVKQWPQSVADKYYLGLETVSDDFCGVAFLWV